MRRTPLMAWPTGTVAFVHEPTTEESVDDEVWCDCNADRPPYRP
jgi:hypothetical protein